MAYSAINVIFAILNFAVLCILARALRWCIRLITARKLRHRKLSATERALANECFYRHWSHFYQSLDNDAERRLVVSLRLQPPSSL